MSHIFLFGGVKIGSNTAFHCFVYAEEIDLFHKMWSMI